MNRYLAGLGAGLLAGALAAAALIALDRRGLDLLTLLVGLGAGLLAGALAGWRHRQPRSALLAGMVAGLMTGLVAGALLLAGGLAGVAAYSARTIALAPLSLVVCVGVATALAGIISAWTGYPGSAQTRPAKRPKQTGASGPMGPLPTPA